MVGGEHIWYMTTIKIKHPYIYIYYIEYYTYYTSPMVLWLYLSIQRIENQNSRMRMLQKDWFCWGSETRKWCDMCIHPDLVYLSDGYHRWLLPRVWQRGSVFKVNPMLRNYFDQGGVEKGGKLGLLCWEIFRLARQKLSKIAWRSAREPKGQVEYLWTARR